MQPERIAARGAGKSAARAAATAQSSTRSYPVVRCAEPEAGSFSGWSRRCTHHDHERKLGKSGHTETVRSRMDGMAPLPDHNPCEHPGGVSNHRGGCLEPTPGRSRTGGIATVPRPVIRHREGARPHPNPVRRARLARVQARSGLLLRLGDLLERSEDRASPRRWALVDLRRRLIWLRMGSAALVFPPVLGGVSRLFCHSS
jgi:hypothetical protein